MKIVTRGSLSSHGRRLGWRWNLLAALLGALLPALAAADVPPPELRPVMEEINTGESMVQFALNRHSVLWSELNRTALFKVCAADAALLASLKEVRDGASSRLKGLEATQAGAGEQFTFEQLSQIGPTVATLNSPPSMEVYGRVLMQHDASPEYLRTVLGVLFADNTSVLEELFLRPNPKFEMPAMAYRVRNNWTILQSDRGARALLNDHRVQYTGGHTTEDAAVAMKKAPLAGHADAFVKDVGGGSPWLSSFLVDFDFIGKLADAKAGPRGPENPELFGPKAMRVARGKEWINKDGRFEAVGEIQGANLHTNLFFGGADQPLNPKLGAAIPEEAAFALYANTDMGAVQRAGPAEFAGRNETYVTFIKELQENYKEVTTGINRWNNVEPAKVQKGPDLDRGLLVVLFDPDRLEELESGFCVAFGVKPGFKATEAWARAVLHAQEDTTVVNDGGEGEGNKPEFKSIEYSGVTIFTAKQWRTQCVAVTDSAFLIGPDLKNIKRMIRTLQNVEKNGGADNKFVEWAAIQALAPKDPQTNLCGFALVRTPALLRKYGNMAMGGLALLFPKVQADVNWTKISEGLQPSVGALTYNAAEGFRARTLSDLPVVTSTVVGLNMAVLTEIQYEGGYFYRGDRGQQGDDDLPPPGGGANPNGGDGVIEPQVVPVP